MTYCNKKLILIADDLEKVINYYEANLESDETSTISASSLRELDEVFTSFFSEIDAIILDGCIPRHSVNTLGFIKRARQMGFNKPIIAASSLYEYRELMVVAGCSHESPKGDAPDLALHLVGARA